MSFSQGNSLGFTDDHTNISTTFDDFTSHHSSITASSTILPSPRNQISADIEANLIIRSLLDADDNESDKPSDESKKKRKRRKKNKELDDEQENNKENDEDGDDEEIKPPKKARKKILRGPRGAYGCQCSNNKYRLKFRNPNTKTFIEICDICRKGQLRVQCLPERCCQSCKVSGTQDGGYCDFSLKFREDDRLDTALEKKDIATLLASHVFQNFFDRYLSKPMTKRGSRKKFPAVISKFENLLPFRYLDLEQMKLEKSSKESQNTSSSEIV